MVWDLYMDDRSSAPFSFEISYIWFDVWLFNGEFLILVFGVLFSVFWSEKFFFLTDG